MILDKMDRDQLDSGSLDMEGLKEAMLTYICTENKAFFKSQQINEPEISFDERKEIAERILIKSHPKFLQRFGMNMAHEHLRFFEAQTYDHPDEREEVSESLRKIKWNFENHGMIVRNRRYAAQLKLISEKKYFSESEMRERDPLLFEQLVGQYQSAAAKRASRRPDPKVNTLVDVLLEGIDHDHNKEVESRQRLEESNMLGHDEDSQVSVATASTGDSDSESDHNHWGNFDEPEAGNSARLQRTRKRPANLITAGERDLLYEEFLGIMYSNFLLGKDTEFFDYSTVDSNEEYDDVVEIDQDCEDKYFDEESQDSPAQPTGGIADDDSEDELDVYMKHLEKNLHQRNGFQEEFDE